MSERHQTILLLPILTMIALIWALVARARPLALGLLAAGLIVQVVPTARLVRSTLGGVGGHAEWVRAMSVRPRLARSPAWGLGIALAAAGVLVALAS
jgi:hypothetical protein